MPGWGRRSRWRLRTGSRSLQYLPQSWGRDSLKCIFAVGTRAARFGLIPKGRGSCRTMANKNGDVGKFKRAIDKQNRSEHAHSGTAKRKRDTAEGEAAKHGLGALEKHS